MPEANGTTAPAGSDAESERRVSNALRLRIAELEAVVGEQKERLRRLSDGVVAFGGLRLSRLERTASLDGSPLKLLPREYHLLVELALASGATVGKGTLESAVWGRGLGRKANAVAVHVSRIRAKLKGRSIGIVTERGAGYRLASDGALPANGVSQRL